MANGLQVRDIASAATVRTMHNNSFSRRTAYDEENEKEDFGDNFKIDFTSDTTLHGLRNACKKGTTVIRRILWIIVLLAMTVGCIAMIAESIVKYMRFDSVTSTSKLLNKTLELPAITVCNINVYKASVVLQKYPMIYTYQVLQNKGLENLTPEELFQVHQIAEQLKTIQLKSFMEDVSQTPEEMFVSCHFLSATANKPCSAYLTPLFNNRGKCYTFHSEDYITEQGAVNVIQPGPSYGVTLTLNTMKEEYYYTFGLGYGLQVLVHDPGVYPLMEQKSFVVSPGRETLVALQKFVTKRLPMPYSEADCVDPSLPENDGYSPERCFLDCLSKIYTENTCSYTSYADITCTLYDVYATLENLQVIGDLAQNCQCLPTCTEVFYQYRLSTTEFPNNLAMVYAMEHNWNTTNMTYVKDNFSHLKIYFDTMEYVTNEQLKSITLEQVVADIGGQLGICLGASLITLAEFLDYALVGIHMLYRKCTRRCSNKVIKVQPNNQLY